VYACVHVHMRVYAHVCVHQRVHMGVAFSFAWVRACACLYVCTATFLHKSKHIHVFQHMLMNSCASVCTLFAIIGSCVRMCMYIIVHFLHDREFIVFACGCLSLQSV
jgi:hypothetical protein